MMHCEDVIKELAAPTEGRDTAALGDHLRRCSSCAAWAQRAAQLDSLWQATQPAEPSPNVWDAMWVRLASSLEVTASKEFGVHSTHASRNGSAKKRSRLTIQSKPGQHPLPTSFRSRLWATIGVAGLAQAAAILFVAGLTWRFFIPPHPMPIQQGVPGPNGPKSASIIPPGGDSVAAMPSVEIEEGHLVVIVAERKNPKVLDWTPDVATTGAESWYLDWNQVYNEVESLDKPKVAMKE